jgi:pilus assembly protein CpaC
MITGMCLAIALLSGNMSVFAKATASKINSSTDAPGNRGKKYSIKTGGSSVVVADGKQAGSYPKGAVAGSKSKRKLQNVEDSKEGTVRETKILEMPSEFTVDDSSEVGKSKKEIFVETNVGKTKEIEVNSVNFVKLRNKAHEIFIPDPTVADVQLLSDSSLYLMGLAPGSTSLVITDKDSNIMLDCKIRVTYPLKAIKEAILEMHPDTDVEILSVDSSIILKGKVPSPEVAASIQEIAGKFIEAAKIVNKLSIETATQVMLKVKIAEVTRDITKNLGISWRALSPYFSDGTAGLSYGFTGGGVIAALDSTALETGSSMRDAVLGESGTLAGKAEGGRWFVRSGGAVSDLSSVIDALAGESFASILAEPTIIALSGKKATFKSGGEQGYKVTQPGGGAVATTEFKEWGTSIEFTPVVLSEDRITITVTPKVSTLVTQAGVDTPSLTSKEATTTVELGSGQSLAIAGLLQKNVDTTASETPFLSEIPLLGSLFRNSYLKKIEKELVIIVTPYIVKPSSKPLKAPTDMVPVICSPAESIWHRKFFKNNRTMRLGSSTGYTVK